ncbi:MAG: phosphate transport system regulatory protein PhoU [Phycisphaerae bacterium]|nr:MAG: phosphate transport system regulatory protein PhoU [Phycisphaerae bacterium]
MPTSPEGFIARIDHLKRELVAQGRRVQTMLEAAFEALFERSANRADWAIAQDDEVDLVDVRIEQHSVQLLTDATRQGAELDATQLRTVLMVVKVNNELERAADVASDIAARAKADATAAVVYPDTFRVMANSVIGIVRDANTAIARNDPALAKIVLQSQHAVAAFKDAVLRDAEAKLATGHLRPDAAFLLHETANDCELIADHCTNIAEQVIYLTTGSIVRHTEANWVQLPQPPKE